MVSLFWEYQLLITTCFQVSWVENVFNEHSYALLILRYLRAQRACGFSRRLIDGLTSSTFLTGSILASFLQLIPPMIFRQRSFWQVHLGCLHLQGETNVIENCDHVEILKKNIRLELNIYPSIMWLFWQFLSRLQSVFNLFTNSWRWFLSRRFWRISMMIFSARNQSAVSFHHGKAVHSMMK